MLYLGQSEGLEVTVVVVLRYTVKNRAPVLYSMEHYKRGHTNKL